MVRFGKHPELVIHTDEPFNAGPPPHRLIEAPITPNALFYVRNHGTVPDVGRAAYRLRVGGLVRESLVLGLDDLAAFPARTVLATLQCAGNRRRALMAHAPIPGELAWDDDAISTAEWRGVALRDVLLAAGILLEDGAHIAFSALDAVERGGETFGFGGSIPVERALQPDVLLATHMNGEPLPPVHGFPLRVVVPGYIGARSVKWLGEVRVQATPSDNYFQARAYRLFPGWINGANVDYERGLMLGETPVNSIIYAPEAGQTVTAGRVAVRGIAIAGLRAVVRVEISTNGGRSWQEATLLPPVGENASAVWRFWQAEVELTAGSYELVVRAWDAAANTQPADVSAVWNFKGYANNAWHRVTVTASVNGSHL